MPSYPTVTSGSTYITSQFYLPPPNQPKIEMRLNGQVKNAENRELTSHQSAGDSSSQTNLTSMSSLKHLKQSLNSNVSRSMQNLREVEVIEGKDLSDPTPLGKDNRSSSMDVGKSLEEEDLAKLCRISRSFVDEQALSHSENRKSHTLPSQLTPSDLECFVPGSRPGIGHFHLSRHLKKSVSLLPNPMRGLTSVLSSRGQQQKAIGVVTRYIQRIVIEATCFVLTFRVRSGKGVPRHEIDVQKVLKRVHFQFHQCWRGLHLGCLTLLYRSRSDIGIATEKIGKGLSKIKHGVLGKSMEGVADPLEPAYDMADICVRKIASISQV